MRLPKKNQAAHPLGQAAWQKANVEIPSGGDQRATIRGGTANPSPMVSLYKSANRPKIL